MKNKIIFGILLIVLLFCLSGCSSEAQQEGNRFIAIDEIKYVGTVYYDRQTKVEYLQGWNGYGGTAFTLLVDAEGKPLLYEGE